MMKSAKVLRVNEVPEMALWWKVAAQVESRPFGHVGESKSDLLLISVVDCFVDKEVELHGM